MNEGGVMRQISIEKLFADNQQRLSLTWLAGRQGGNRMLIGESGLKPTIGQVGHMNFVHPFRVQLIGAAEANYMRGLPEDALRASIARLFTTELAAIIVANGEQVLAQLPPRPHRPGLDRAHRDAQQDRRLLRAQPIQCGRLHHRS